MSRHLYKIACLTFWLVPLLFAIVPSLASELGEITVWSGRVVDPEGHAIPGATVLILADGLSMWERDRLVEDWIDPDERTTDEDGTFEAVNFLSPPCTLRAEASGWAPRTVRAVSPGDTTITFELERGRRIAGRVVDAANGKPVAGARVTVCDREAATFGRAACREERADSDGAFIINALSRDELRIGAVATGCAASALDKIAPGEEDLGGIVIRLGPGASVAGTVVDHHGDPVAGARVRFPPEGRRVGDPRAAAPSWPVFTGEGASRAWRS